MTNDEYKPSDIMKYFSYSHLPSIARQASEPICELAHEYDRSLPRCAEKSAGLRKLLEAKDCLVRAAIEEN